MHITANGISIHYELDGSKNAPLVTLSHSLASDMRMWAPQLPVLTADYRVLRFDTRGHGQTDAPEGGYTLELLADDLIALLDSLEIEATHYVGLSMGGMIGQTAVLKDQSRFESLALCDTSSRIPAATYPMWEERIALAHSEGMDALVEGSIDRWFSAGYQGREAEEVDKIRAIIRSTPVAGYCGCSRAIVNLDLTDRLGAITVPTLVIVGADDPATPVAAHEVIAERITDSRLVVLPDALHFSNVEQRQGFNSALLEFLSEHAG